jgi:CDP-diglyceride synthetase
MESSREERELREFSWSNLFLVTGCCFILFAGAMKLVEGSVHPIFLRIGIVCILLRILGFLLKWLGRRLPVKNSSHQHEEVF